MEFVLTRKKVISLVVLACAVVVLTCALLIIEPPLATLFFGVPHENNETRAIINVQAGDTIASVATALEKQHIIASPLALRAFTKFFYSGKSLAAGEYLFSKPAALPVIAWRMSHADFGIPQAEVVVPEGLTMYDIGSIIKQKYPSFDEVSFLTLAKGKEGYLFPDTYHFLEGVKPQEAIDVMTTNFAQHVDTLALQAEIKASGHTEKEIVTMASILEGEAQSEADRKIVAGILWKRIQQGIRLQVDSTLKYENGRGSAELTTNDLETDTPYNTYRNYGLPPGPISNPGVQSIQAALQPIVTEYVYFLTDNDGVMHYAETFQQHVANKQKYLK